MSIYRAPCQGQNNETNRLSVVFVFVSIPYSIPSLGRWRWKRGMVETSCSISKTVEPVVEAPCPPCPPALHLDSVPVSPFHAGCRKGGFAAQGKLSCLHALDVEAEVVIAGSVIHATLDGIITRPDKNTKRARRLSICPARQLVRLSVRPRSAASLAASMLCVPICEREGRPKNAVRKGCRVTCKNSPGC